MNNTTTVEKKSNTVLTQINTFTSNVTSERNIECTASVLNSFDAKC